MTLGASELNHSNTAGNCMFRVKTLEQGVKYIQS